MPKKGYLVLDDGKIFEGTSFGSENKVYGEVVFNTGMVGYPEGFTDPSYYGQILVMTYPLIGNYGVPPDTKETALPEYMESTNIYIRGLIVTSYIGGKTHYQATRTLSDWLKKENVPALTDIDTRSLTQIIREKGVMKGIITFQESRPEASGLFFKDINEENLVELVSCKKPTIYGTGKFRVLLIDCGVKLNQIRLLLNLDTTVIRIPWDYDPFGKIEFDAIMISNGPGDPKMAGKTIEIIKEGLKRKIPTLGVCLGNQLLALATGANTYKLKYGHRGQNQPVRDELTKKCYITTQNHGFAVDTNTLTGDYLPWFSNLNDSTNEGIKHKTLPIYSTQFHPEDAPGPTDTRFILEHFIKEATLWLQNNH
ncbi:glutamine-hydrolyzing carbamoyl-phosphate synthase small subunit [Candidatus Gottesmanbacteria bacterium]|nr:glutamine-hydrolyzing carbamoyl-phosphate synthase small subunit [Candidatus Gottesmanbacteria bacterium]